MNVILGRQQELLDVQRMLLEFEANKHNPLAKRGLYVYGSSGCGKTCFVRDVLRAVQFDAVWYDASDVRNKNIMDAINKHNMGDRNIMRMFQRERQPIAIVMDEMDGINTSDKSGIVSLIKMVRPKKTKKQLLEESTGNFIVCVGNHHMDKKIKELMKVCHVMELKTPSEAQMLRLIDTLMSDVSPFVKTQLHHYVQCDLRKLNTLHRIYVSNPAVFMQASPTSFLLPSNNHDDTRFIIGELLSRPCAFDTPFKDMNETERTIVGMLWHENVADCLDAVDNQNTDQHTDQNKWMTYLAMLSNLCVADNIDRVTFQKQIWQFNEMSSLIKTFKNNQLFHSFLQSLTQIQQTKPTIRFTKILTKYSTEYNNSMFVQRMCQELMLEKHDVFVLFAWLKLHPDMQSLLLEEYSEVSKLDVQRMYRYLNRSTPESEDDTDSVLPLSMSMSMSMPVDDNHNHNHRIRGHDMGFGSEGDGGECEGECDMD